MGDLWLTLEGSREQAGDHALAESMAEDLAKWSPSPVATAQSKQTRSVARYSPPPLYRRRVQGLELASTRQDPTTLPIMAPATDATVPATRRTRRSIASHTDVHKAMEKENATVDVTSSLAASRKKSRSKSLGPGGLDALMKANGNRRLVHQCPFNLRYIQLT